MSRVVTDNLPLVAGAPAGVEALRKLILELAICGKLVNHDVADEPAEALLARVQNVRSALEESGAIRKLQTGGPIRPTGNPFPLPESWKWAELGELAYPQAGFAFKANHFNDIGEGLPLIRIRDVGQQFSGTYYSGEYRPEFIVNRGDHLISMDGQFRVAQWMGNAALLNQRVCRLAFFGEELNHRFVAMSLQARLLELQGTKAYTTVDHLSGGQISAARIALPPLAEQRRIVAKVDELMSLCDSLEAEQGDAETAHSRLLEGVLGALTQARDATEFADSWKLVAENFHELFTTAKSVDALRQTALQLAVMGKLTPRDATDEPASHLLQRIAQEKSVAASSGKIRSPKENTDIRASDLPFPLPSSWEWARLSALSLIITDGTHYTPTYVKSGIAFLSVKDMSGGALDFGSTRFVTAEEHSTLTKRCKPERGDLLITKVGTTGVPVVVDTDRPFSIFVSVALVKGFWEFVNVNYLRLAVASPLIRRQSAEGTEGTGNKNLVLKKIADFLVPVPPLAEQQRIVAKVDELMALCDQVKAELVQARELHERLSNALVEQAVA